MSEIFLRIAGSPPRKSNGRRIVTAPNGKPRSIKSEAALQWVESAIWQIPESARQRLGSAKRPLVVSCWIVYTSKRPDLSAELVTDMLQEANVISDDRHIYEMHLYKEFDKDGRVDILIEERE